MTKAFHRGGLIGRCRQGLKTAADPIIAALALLNAAARTRVGYLVCVAIAAVVVGRLSGLAGTGVLVIGMAQEFLGSDVYKLMYAWGLLDVNGGLRCQGGIGGLFGKALIALDEQFTIAGVGNGADLTDDTAYTKVIPGNTLKTNGDEIWVEAELLSAANGNNKTAKIILGGTTLLTTGVITSNAKNIQLRLRIIRTAAGTQLWFATVIVDGVAAVLTKGTGAEDLTTALNLKLTLASPTTGAANDLLAFRWSAVLASLTGV